MFLQQYTGASRRWVHTRMHILSTGSYLLDASQCHGEPATLRAQILFLAHLKCLLYKVYILHRSTSNSIRQFMMPCKAPIGPPIGPPRAFAAIPPSSLGGRSQEADDGPPFEFIVAGDDGQVASLQRCVVHCRCSTEVHIRLVTSCMAILANHEEVLQMGCCCTTISWCMAQSRTDHHTACNCTY